jgi:oxygen-independent coproporphyrinogen-3 oxidase
MDPTVGVYLHVPFCERICPYCDFAVVRAPQIPAADENRFVTALLRELDARHADFEGHCLETIYFGGGTPSRLESASIARVVRGVRDAFAVPADRPLEVTLEVNPGTLERSRLPGFRAAGVDRLSIGVQSFDDETLRRLGRAHRAAEAHATLDAARGAGFDNLSLDLIYAAPGQSVDGLVRDLDAALAHAPQHLSAYSLTIESGTPFARGAARGQLALADEDAVVDMMERLESRLGAAGLARYEISNYARPGFESRHNRRYWARVPVLALGPGAHSTEVRTASSPYGQRRANLRSLEAWLARIEADEPGDAGEPETLDAPTARGEAMLLGLRTNAGVCAALFAEEFGAPPRGFFGGEIDALVRDGLLVEAGQGSLQLTRRGRLLADSVCERFVCAPR